MKRRMLFIEPKDICDQMNLSETEMFRQIVRFHKLIGPDMVKNKNILEIGAGNGIFSALMSLAGASSVTAMEPEAAGSSNGVVAVFKQITKRLKLNNCHLIADTLQQSRLQPSTYDLIVAIASVNHWHEPACIKLNYDVNSQNIYIALFKKCFNCLKPQGKIIISDVGRRNFFAMINATTGIKHPFAPNIEWHKHQQPKLWAALLQKAGFQNITWKWICPPPLKFGIDKLINNFVAAYFTASYFLLKAQK